MKIWFGYGTEHSANLVIVGTFKTVDDAQQAKGLIDEWTELTREIEPSQGETKFPKEILEFFVAKNFMWADQSDLRTLLYDYGIEQDEDKLVVKTEETDFAAFIKVMLRYGAKVETYSAHNYNNTPYGRGR